MNDILKLVVSAIVGAVMIDIQTFAKARETNAEAKYDWVELWIKVTLAMLGSVTVLLGGSLPQG